MPARGGNADMLTCARLSFSPFRFCISAAHSEADLIDALKVVSEVAEQVMIKYKWNGRPNVVQSKDIKQNKVRKPVALPHLSGAVDGAHCG